MAHLGACRVRNPADNGYMRSLRSSLIGSLVAASLLAVPVAAEPAAQSVAIDVTPARLTVYPLGTARVQMVLTNSTRSEQVFALEILLVRGDGSVATAYLSDALALAPGITTTAIYSIRHADGAVEAVVTPRRWPELVP
jgi:hypothetical protein